MFFVGRSFRNLFASTIVICIDSIDWQHEKDRFILEWRAGWPIWSVVLLPACRYIFKTSTLQLTRRPFFKHFSKTQQEKNSQNSKTQPVFSSKLRKFSRKLNFSATLLSESEIKNSKNSTKLRIFSQNSVFRQIHLRPHPHKC